MKRSLRATLVLVVSLGAALTLTTGALVARAATPAHLDNAYQKLRRAHYVLAHGCRHLGGHRMAAMNHVHLAIGEIEAAVRASGGSLPAVSQSTSIKMAHGQVHPYLHDALRQCREAKAELAVAKDNKGHHRLRAMQQVDAAIVQLQQALTEPRCGQGPVH